METILFGMVLPEPMLVKTDLHLYTVYATGIVSRWNEEQDEFMMESNFEIGQEFIKELRFTAFPKFFPQPQFKENK